MSKAYEHNGKEILHGAVTECGEYQATRVDGKWYFHPTDAGWLAFNRLEDFSEQCDSEEEALEAADAWKMENN